MRVAGEDEVYTAATIFDYLDGGAEVYRAYNLRACLARRWTGSAGEITLDLFAMGSSADAFGVFTHDQDGETIELGQGASLRPGWLSLWKGEVYVSITAERDDQAAQMALLALGRAVADAILETGAPPALLTLLPPKGIVPRTVRYLHDPVVLSAHLDLGEGNPLRVDASTEVVLARYRRASGDATLLVASYPTARKARQAARNVATALLPGAGKKLVGQAADGSWCGVQRNHRTVALVMAGGSSEVAAELLREATAAVPGSQ